MKTPTPNLMTTERPCSHCQVIKPVELFYRSKNSKMGRDNQCIECRNQYHKEESYKATRRIASRKYISKYPDRQTARELAEKHKNTVKKTYCEKCGSSDKLHMHHPDYTEPLKIMTLCIPCHARVHHG